MDSIGSLLKETRESSGVTIEEASQDLDIKENYLTVSASSEVGKMSENIVINLEGKDLSIAFNSKFLTECIKVIDDEFINLHFNTKINPCVIKPYYGDDYLYLILPLRINA